MKKMFLLCVFVLATAGCGQDEAQMACETSANYKGRSIDESFETLTYETKICLRTNEQPGPDALRIEISDQAGADKFISIKARKISASVFEIALPTEPRDFILTLRRPADNQRIPSQLIISQQIVSPSR